MHYSSILMITLAEQRARDIREQADLARATRTTGRRPSRRSALIRAAARTRLRRPATAAQESR